MTEIASLIAMLVLGGVLFISWAVWDGFFAKYPIMPRRVLNRTFVCHVLYTSIKLTNQFACVFIDFFYFFSSYLVDTYFSSWTWVVTDWSVSPGVAKLVQRLMA
jgi:hypothetical protein